MNGIPNKTELSCFYEKAWEDGYGARGWKLRSGVSDPEIIASTAATGDRIPTSVFIHDILDHALCGLGPSGHRNEAIALIQLATRTRADPGEDFAQMVDEDLLHGRVLGESFRSFLPIDLLEGFPPSEQGGKETIKSLERRLGRSALRERLIAHFFEIGAKGAFNARQQFCSHGLDYRRRGPLGLALQWLLEQADDFVQMNNWERAVGSVSITDEWCCFEISEPVSWKSLSQY
jgi:hypothetical protein